MNRTPTWLTNFFLLVIALTGAVAGATNLSAISPNNRGVKELRSENAYKGYRALVEAANADTFDPVVRLNLGVAYLLNKEPDKAAAEFKLAEQFAGDDAQVRFMARFNQAIVATEKGDIAQALAHYQGALEIRPDSVEVKTNIELLWQQQGQGGGKDENQESSGKSQSGEGGESDQPDQNQNQDRAGDQRQKQQPKPFESQELTDETVRKILEELKSQEQRVRAEHYSKGAKERPREKQW